MNNDVTKYQPTIIAQGETVWGICTVATRDGKPLLAVFRREEHMGEVTWWGCATVETHNSGALMGSANKEVHLVLEFAHDAWLERQP